jgi:hypothetical protein
MEIQEKPSGVVFTNLLPMSPVWISHEPQPKEAVSRELKIKPGTRRSRYNPTITRQLTSLFRADISDRMMRQ